MTLDLYLHFLPDMQHAATSAMDSILGFGSRGATDEKRP